MSWRDSLFVWGGTIKLESPEKRWVPDKGAPNGGCWELRAHIAWAGTWVSVDMADARAVPAPSARALATALMQFEVESAPEPAVVDAASEAREGEAWIPCCADPQAPGSPAFLSGLRAQLSAGRGWELEGEGGKTWHKDEVHELMVCGPADSGAASGATSHGRDHAAARAVAVGRNQFGPFVSAGVVRARRADGGTGAGAGAGSAASGRPAFQFELLLARRYLAPKDARARWSVAELDAAVLSGRAQRGHHVLPWHTSALHARARRPAGGGLKKRARSGAAADAGSSGAELAEAGEAGPSLSMPCAEPFELRLDLRDEPPPRRLSASPNLQWERQCWGCGQAAQHAAACDARACAAACSRMRLLLRQEGAEEPHEPSPHGEFLDAELCGPACARRAAVRIAEACAHWAAPGAGGSKAAASHAKHGAGVGLGVALICHDQRDSAAFWSALEGTEVGATMARDGWRITEGGKLLLERTADDSTVTV